jgi:flagellar motor switch protein FliM
MSEVLDQAEIDALLASVTMTESGGTSASAGKAAGLPRADGGPARSPPSNASTYDFKRPERVSKDHIRALGSIHEGFARNFGATLSGFLRTIIDVRVVGVEQLTTASSFTRCPTRPASPSCRPRRSRARCVSSSAR